MLAPTLRNMITEKKSRSQMFQEHSSELLADLKVAIDCAKDKNSSPDSTLKFSDKFGLPSRRRQKRLESCTKQFFKSQLSINSFLMKTIKTLFDQERPHEITNQNLMQEIQSLKAQVEILKTLVRPNVSVGEGTILTKTLHGHKMYLPAADQSLVPCIMMDGQWEPGTTQFLSNLVKPGMKVMDIGANVGWYSVLLASWVGASGKVLSFEANPSLVPLVRRSMRANGFSWAKVELNAVMDESREVAFYARRDEKGGSSLNPGTSTSADSVGDHTDVIQVPGITIDDYILKNAEWQKVDLVRMDIEGAEYLALKGMRNLVQTNPGLKLVIEYAPQMIQDFAGSVVTFVDLLVELGFKKFQVVSDLETRTISPDEMKREEGNAVIFDILCEQ